MPKRLPTGITKLPSGQYAVRPYDRVAKKKGPQQKFDTLSEAVSYKEQVDAGKILVGAAAWTCDKWATEWTTNPRWERPKESTNIHNAERVAKFAEDFAGVALHAIDPSAAYEWAQEHPSRLSAVRTMLNDARKIGLIADNPFERLGIRRGNGRKHIHPMTEAEVKLLADCAYEKWPDWPVMGSMILFSAYSGLRLGECLALRWTDLDWEKGTILVERQWVQKTRSYGPTKSGHPRLVPLVPQAANSLRLLDRGSPAGGKLVWYSPRGKRIEPSLHDYYWRQTRERFLGKISAERTARIDLEWHVLRHFMISWLVDRGVTPQDVAGAVGHSDGGRLVQELYGHLYPDNSITRIQKVLAA